jgi:hypothetical protein
VIFVRLNEVAVRTYRKHADRLPQMLASMTKGILFDIEIFTAVYSKRPRLPRPASSISTPTARGGTCRRGGQGLRGRRRRGEERGQPDRQGDRRDFRADHRGAEDNDRRVAAIQGIGATIGEISQIASAIADAVDQQRAATREIARKGQEVAQAAASPTWQR